MTLPGTEAVLVTLARQQDGEPGRDAQEFTHEPDVITLADAWDQGYQQACDDINWEHPHNTRMLTPNPYRGNPDSWEWLGMDR